MYSTVCQAEWEPWNKHIRFAIYSEYIQGGWWIVKRLQLLFLPSSLLTLLSQKKSRTPFASSAVFLSGYLWSPLKEKKGHLGRERITLILDSVTLHSLSPSFLGVRSYLDLSLCFVIYPFYILNTYPLSIRVSYLKSNIFIFPNTDINIKQHWCIVFQLSLLEAPPYWDNMSAYTPQIKISDCSPHLCVSCKQGEIQSSFRLYTEIPFNLLE